MSTKKPRPSRAKKKPTVEVKETIAAPYTFSDSETKELSTDLTRAMREMDELDEQKKALVADFKSRNEQKIALVKNLRRKLEDGFEMRPFEAVVEFLPSQKRKRFLHPKTKEVIREDEMTASDWQLPMFQPAPDGTEKPVVTPASNGAEKPSAKSKNEPSSPEKPDPANAGQTNLGNALDAAAALTDQPKLILDLSPMDYTSSGLLQVFQKAAKTAGWPEAAISVIKDQLRTCDTVSAMQDVLRPHVEGSENPSSEA